MLGDGQPSNRHRYEAYCVTALPMCGFVHIRRLDDGAVFLVERMRKDSRMHVAALDRRGGRPSARERHACVSIAGTLDTSGWSVHVGSVGGGYVELTAPGVL